MRPAAPAPAARAQLRGTTTTGTGEWRTIFAAREPRKTRATGPTELEPTRARRRPPTRRPRAPRPRLPRPITSSWSSPSAARTSRSHWAAIARSVVSPDAGLDRRPRPHHERRDPQARSDASGDLRGSGDDAIVRAPEGGRQAFHRAVRAAAEPARRECERERRGVHEPVAGAAEMHIPERARDRRSQNEHARSVAPTRSATSAAATTSRSSEPPKATVTRCTGQSPRQRNPRGASATGIGEQCTSPSETLPSDVPVPSAPADADPSTIMRASCCSATSSRPAGVERAWWTTKRAPPAAAGGPRRARPAPTARSSAWYSASTRAGPGAHGAGTTEPRAGPRRPCAPASPPGPARARPRPSGAKPTTKVIAPAPARSGGCRR